MAKVTLEITKIELDSGEIITALAYRLPSGTVVFKNLDVDVLVRDSSKIILGIFKTDDADDTGSLYAIPNMDNTSSRIFVGKIARVTGATIDHHTIG